GAQIFSREGRRVRGGKWRRPTRRPVEVAAKKAKGAEMFSRPRRLLAMCHLRLGLLCGYLADTAKEARC
ncbi:MAG TPA: hypothetical protein VGA18_07115, partial [Rhodothermales bacterium]